MVKSFGESYSMLDSVSTSARTSAKRSAFSVQRSAFKSVAYMSAIIGLSGELPADKHGVQCRIDTIPQRSIMHESTHFFQKNWKLKP